MLVIYRISEGGYNKVKPDYATKIACLQNALKCFPPSETDWCIIADNASANLIKQIREVYPKGRLIPTYLGNGAATYNRALDLIIQECVGSSEIVYMLEDDYLHKEGSKQAIEQAIAMGAHYVTLYDHPDKYQNGVNPFVDDGGEPTKLFLTESCHWKLTNSTTMTFACTVGTLWADIGLHRKYTEGKHPRDYEMWRALATHHHASLVSAVPGYSTHCETAWLAPLTDWSKQC